MRPKTGEMERTGTREETTTTVEKTAAATVAAARRTHLETARELLTRKLSIRLKDGRTVVGDFMCMDTQGNIVLYNAAEYRAGAQEDMRMGGGQVVLVPYEQQTSDVCVLP